MAASVTESLGVSLTVNRSLVVLEGTTKSATRKECVSHCVPW